MMLKETKKINTMTAKEYLEELIAGEGELWFGLQGSSDSINLPELMESYAQHKQKELVGRAYKKGWDDCIPHDLDQQQPKLQEYLETLTKKEDGK